MHPAGERHPGRSGEAPGRSARILPGPSPAPVTRPAPEPAPEIRGWLLGLALGLAYVALRTPPPMLGGYEADVTVYIRWLEVIAGGGLRNVYARSNFDSPPLYAYLLWTMAKGQLLLHQLRSAAHK